MQPPKQSFSSESSSTFGIGIDFGTSNSAAAVFDGEQVILVKLAEHSAIMPSANYVDRDFVTSTGQNAIDDYIKGNQGRKVELSVEVLGEARTSAGSADGPAGEGETSKVYGQAFNDSGPSVYWVIQIAGVR